MNKNRIRLTESQLHRVIKESVKNVLNEELDMQYYRKRFMELPEEMGQTEFMNDIRDFILDNLGEDGLADFVIHNDLF